MITHHPVHYFGVDSPPVSGGARVGRVADLKGLLEEDALAHVDDVTLPIRQCLIAAMPVHLGSFWLLVNPPAVTARVDVRGWRALVCPQPA